MCGTDERGKAPWGHCAKCGVWQRLEQDHKVPLCEGGKNEITNLGWICPSCHVVKSRTEVKRFFQTFWTPERREAMRRTMLGVDTTSPVTSEYRTAARDGVLTIWNDPARKQRQIEAIRQAHLRPEVREANRTRVREFHRKRKETA